jgi:peptide/nickel transport system permease protein
MEVLPGDPALLMLGMNASPEALSALREQMGLEPAGDHPLPRLGRRAARRRFRPLLHLFLAGHRPDRRTRIVVSLPLAIISLVSVHGDRHPVGIFAAARRGTASDTLSMGSAQIGVAIPNFWFALLLIYVFAVWLRLVPAGGFPGWNAGIWPGVKSLILPAVALALPQAAILARVTRSALLEVLGEDYIRTARAKGMPRRDGPCGGTRCATP